MAGPPLFLGSATLLTLLGAALLTPLPTQPLAALVMGLGALWLERGGLDLDSGRRHRFSPAVSVYLAMSALPGVGSTLAAVFLVVDALHRMERGVMLNLAQRLPLAAAVLATSATVAWGAAPSAAALAVGPLCYLLGTWARWRTSAGAQEDLAAQRQLQFRIGPLELALAAAAPLVGTGAQLNLALFVAILPLLACSHLGAQNALLTAHDETIAGVLEQLKGVRAQADRATLQRDRALQEKQILEGFSRQLAGQPDLESVASNLVATVGKVMPVDSVVVFLGSPPEPFGYSASPAHQMALQGSSLTALREPLVDRAFREQKPVLQRKPPEVAERLLRDDRVAAALPLGGAAVLYAGRHSEQAFTPAEQDRLKWLAGKAALALEAAFQAHEQARSRRLQEQTVDRLEKKVAWLSQLVQGAEAMASSLESEVLVERFTTDVGHTVTHAGGQLLLEGQPPTLWGVEFTPHPELLATARGTGRPLVIEETARSRFGAPGDGISSLVIVPLLARRDDCLGILILASDRKAAFSSEQVDLLFLLCSQAAMALSHATLYRQVLEGRRQLEESQASLVQSSKLTAIGQLAAGVAHELNSPLGAISLSVGEALNQLDEKPELSRRFMTRAHTAVKKAKEIVNRLMSYSRKAENQLQTLSLESVTRDTLDFLAFQLRSAEVEVEVAADPASLVEGEAQPLQQVVTNLVLNAAQALEERPASQRRMWVSIRAGEGSVELSVKDNGPGVQPENLSRIFDPFFTTKPVGRGTGLGLWACQQIVSQHGGSISVESLPEVEGTTFTVRLPAARPQP